MAADAVKAQAAATVEASGAIADAAEGAAVGVSAANAKMATSSTAASTGPRGQQQRSGAYSFLKLGEASLNGLSPGLMTLLLTTITLGCRCHDKLRGSLPLAIDQQPLDSVNMDPLPARPENLPDFERPPIDEVVLGLEFRRLEGFTQAHLGELWSEIKAEYPRTEDHPALIEMPPQPLSGVPGFPLPLTLPLP